MQIQYQYRIHHIEFKYNSIIHNSLIKHHEYNHGIRLLEKYMHIYKIMLGMHETNKVCLNVGVLAISDTIKLCVMAFPKCTGGALHVLLALLLGAGDSGGLDKIVESLGMGESVICWFECCSVEASVFVNTLSDA